MDGVGESSSVGEKPVVVRVKRKVGQSPLDAFWLEINERPFKRPFLDFSKLSLSNSEKKEDVKPKKVLVRHLETVTDSETTVDIIHSLFESDDLGEQSCSKGKFEDRKIAFKKNNRKEQLLTKAVQQQQTAAQDARFEQIWRSRKGNKEGIHDKELHERCSFYDVIRVDAEERPGDGPPEVESLEDQKMLASFLPLLRECIPTAAEEIEAGIHSSHTEEYVYDFYAVNEEMDISEDSSKHQFPLVTVEEEEEFYDGPDDESDYDSDDSNAEDHPRNDYPDEISEEEEEEEEEDDEEDEDEEEKSEASDDESKDKETSERRVRMVLDEDEEFFDGYAEEDVNVYGDSDDEEFEDIKWSYR
ncbi:PREDICTED: RNA-directed DNA methylation 4 [Brassica oleracea var. oleracea]|uniref:Transcription factor Iwr1 domain-containing protein n=1 Tax=Brassica oleracea var. oleracea TaxID=109376 RepID=A0A0D3BTK5_BRAOL|nr:PREDICTED: RNA-directed DNA methylation 4 [Brassica oleracea var. oleracea]XP_013633742.1 PREDICTED: RNA-directed DNA methylation 4 [Brassica oleracea var. oleracea]XP_013633743.1 PREDICTED: RNA-directed DNA methylation 4 [Brassica oleracea var. oleracea]